VVRYYLVLTKTTENKICLMIMRDNKSRVYNADVSWATLLYKNIFCHKSYDNEAGGRPLYYDLKMIG